HHNRGGTTRSGTAGEVIGWVRAWLAESKFADGVELDATTHQIGPILGTILEKHRDYFCVGDGGTRRKAKVYCIESCEWSVSYLDLLKSLPLRWSATRLPDDAVVFSRDDEGAE
ncbi:unnamed protein product, partial [Ectocarpus sp. 13 AM-2016]